MQKLYAEKKINPFGGCLLLFIQISYLPAFHLELNIHQILIYLLFRFMNKSPRKYIPTKELINQLVYLGYEKMSLQTFRNKIIAKLRDNEVIISSSTGGYKIPSTEKELYDFVNHGKSIIMPMISRLKTCNDVIRMGTDGKINLFEKAEYNSLSKMFLSSSMTILSINVVNS